MNFNRLSLLALTAACVIALSACGGGGSSTAASGGATILGTTAGSSYTPSVLTTALVTSVPASTYPIGSEEEIAFNLLNAERQNCGFGLLTQNSILDQTTKGHADWLLINGYTGHNQAAGTPGFTGVASYDRIAAAGYATASTFWSGEVLQDVFFSNKAGLGSLITRRLLNAPYHGIGLISGSKDVGIAVRSSIDTNTVQSRAVLVANVAYENSVGAQSMAMGSVGTYPCAGSTGVEYEMRGEVPNPVPGRNLNSSPIGTSVLVAVNPNQVLTIASATMINVGTGSNVTLRTPVAYTNDPNSMLRMNEAYVAADAPLTPATSYQVTIAGSVDSTPFSRTFTFTTKP